MASGWDKAVKTAKKKLGLDSEADLLGPLDDVDTKPDNPVAKARKATGSEGECPTCGTAQISGSVCEVDGNVAVDEVKRTADGEPIRPEAA